MLFLLFIYIVFLLAVYKTKRRRTIVKKNKFSIILVYKAQNLLNK